MAEHAQLKFETGFVVAMGNTRAQGAVMVLEPGTSEGGRDNRHRGADQWLFVHEGTGLAVVNGKDIALRAGTLLLIEAGETHEIRNTGHGPLKTVNIYAPPAYDSAGDELPRGRN